MNAYASTSFSNTSSEFSNRSPAELRSEIEASREAITDTIKRLDNRMHRVVDWRAQVREHPMIAIGAAAAGGMLLAGMFRRKPTPRERIVDAIAESVEDITDTVRNRVGSELTRTMTGSLLKTAITTILVKKATDYLLQLKADALNSNNSET
jgi:ElaB/YqjD/DUF883 family membrane-anchored ribosome-binding protein